MEVHLPKHTRYEEGFCPKQNPASLSEVLECLKRFCDGGRTRKLKQEAKDCTVGRQISAL